MIEQYRSDPMGLADRVDWIAKLQIINRERERSGIELSDPKIALIDLLYHDTDLDRGLFYRRSSRGHFQRMVTDEQIERATVKPPPTTRAHMRGTFIQAAKQWRRDYTVDWVHLKLNDEMQRTVLLKDPFKSTDERFQKLLASLERHGWEQRQILHKVTFVDGGALYNFLGIPALQWACDQFEPVETPHRGRRDHVASRSRQTPRSCPPARRRMASPQEPAGKDGSRGPRSYSGPAERLRDRPNCP